MVPNECHRLTRWVTFSFCCVLSFCALSVRNCHAEESVSMDEDRQTLTYPRRIVIPDDLDATEVRFVDASQKRRDVYFPIAIYYEGHYRGWQTFLTAIKDRGVRALQEEFVPPIMAVSEPYTFRAMKVGYDDCKSAC